VDEEAPVDTPGPGSRPATSRGHERGGRIVPAPPCSSLVRADPRYFLETISSMAFFISSGVTSRTWVPRAQWWPKGSVTLP